MSALAQRIVSPGTLTAIAQRRGVIKAGELQLAVRAADLLDAARADAQRLLDEAQQQAAQLNDNARREAEQIVAAARADMKNEREVLLDETESEIWERAASYQKMLDERFDGFVDALEQQVFGTVRQALAALGAGMTPEDRIRACVRLVLEQAGRPAEARLAVSEHDRPSAEPLAADLPWPLEIDPALAPGSCVLKSSRGEWRCSFEGNLQRLLQVFERTATDEIREEDGKEDEGEPPIPDQGEIDE